MDSCITRDEADQSSKAYLFGEKCAVEHLNYHAVRLPTQVVFKADVDMLKSSRLICFAIQTRDVQSMLPV